MPSIVVVGMGYVGLSVAAVIGHAAESGEAATEIVKG